MAAFTTEDLKDMNLPREVIEANKQLEEIERQALTGVDGPASEDGNTDDGQTAAAPAQDAEGSAPQDQDDQGAAAGDEQAEGQDEKTGAAPAEGDGKEPPAAKDQAAAKPAEAPKAEDDSWRQKYSVLQGKYNAEVPRLRAVNQALTRENQELKQRLKDLEQGKTATGQGSQAGDQGNTQGEGDIDLDSFGDYGEEFQGLVKLMKRDRARMRELEQRLEGVGQAQTTSAQGQYMRDLYALVGEDLPGKNKDAGFNDWLDQADPLSGRTRRELLGEAATSMDSVRVATFFNTYFDNANPPKTASTPAQSTPAAKPDKAVERQVSPGRSKAEAPPQAQATYTIEDHEALAKKITSGRYPFSFKGKQVATAEDADRLLRRVGDQLLRSAAV